VLPLQHLFRGLRVVKEEEEEEKFGSNKRRRRNLSLRAPRIKKRSFTSYIFIFL
jgi:hypothetical protein